MPVRFAVDSITLDELATILLPMPVIVAIDDLDIEQVLWERRRRMNMDPRQAALPALASAHERVLPVIVFGNTVMPPLLPVVTPGHTVMPPRSSIPNRLIGIVPGRSNRAIQAAVVNDREVLVVFVPELEIPGYRSSEAQQLPTIGVIAQLAEVASQPDGTLEIVLDMSTRALITARLQHDPYYLATCTPHPDPEVAGPEIPALLAAVKAQAGALVPRLPYLTPEQIEEALAFLEEIEHPGQLADYVNYSPTFTFADKIAILNTLDPLERLRLVQRTLSARTLTQP